MELDLDLDLNLDLELDLDLDWDLDLDLELDLRLDLHLELVLHWIQFVNLKAEKMSNSLFLLCPYDMTPGCQHEMLGLAS